MTRPSRPLRDDSRPPGRSRPIARHAASGPYGILLLALLSFLFVAHPAPAAAEASRLQAQEPPAPSAPPSARPASWAMPLTLRGVGNLHRVSDSLYRSEQPSRRGMRRLADSLGVRTVINLRKFHSDRWRVRGTPLRLHELDINTWAIDDADVIRALRIIRWEGRGPYLVHCQHGADRTGTVNAMYRMVFQGWTREEAIREMIEGGYGFHALWKNILRYLQTVDIEKIRAAVETPPPPGAAEGGS